MSDDGCRVFTRKDEEAASVTSVIVSASVKRLDLSFLWKSFDFQAAFKVTCIKEK